jgi:hypothetical protein
MLLLKALHGQELPGVKGSVTRLQMQVEALGWHLDDILFTTDAGAADQRHLAISAKSNVQVRRRGFLPILLNAHGNSQTPTAPHGVSRQLPTALALQERVRRLR